MLQTLSYIINVAPEGVPQVVRLSQNENGRTLAFTLTGAGTVNIPSGSTVTISGTKPDGVVYSQTGTISGTTASFPETTQMTAVAGIWPAKIKVTYNGETIATCKIVMAIDPDPVAPGSVPSSSQLNGLVAEAQQYATYAKYEAFGSPLVAATAAAMTDKTRVYVYTGSETGKTAGHWYYWNGSAWTDGGVYNSQGINTDTTLTLSGMAADAKAVGDEFTHVKQELNPLLDSFGVGYSALSDGKYITSSGNVGTLAGQMATEDYFYIEGYEKVIVLTSLESGTHIAVYNANKTKTRVIADGTGVFKAFEIVPQTNERYIRASCSNNYQNFKIIRVESIPNGLTEDRLVLKSNLFDPTNVTNGYINANSGNIGSLSGSHASGYIPVEPGRKYIIANAQGSSSDSRGLAFYDLSRSYISGIAYDGNLGNIIVTAPDNASFIRITTTETYENVYVGDYSAYAPSGMKAIFPKADNIKSGKYVNLDGNLNNDSSCTTVYQLDVSRARGKRIYVWARIQDAFAIVLTDEGKTKYLYGFNGYTSPAYGITGVGSPQVVTFIVPSDAKHLSYTLPNTFYLSDNDLAVFYSDVEETTLSSSISLFDNFGVIGDSYASGEVYVTGSATVLDNFAWGKIIARKCGMACTLYSRGGLNTRTWLTSSYGLAKLNSESANNLYILALGINDAALGASYLGSVDDLDATTKPDTFYGNYATIIEAVQSKNSHAKIIIMTFRPDGQMNTMRSYYNNAIRNIATHYGIPLVDLTASPFFNSYYYQSHMVSGHPVGVTYSGMATEIERLIEKAMVDNASYFANYTP